MTALPDYSDVASEHTRIVEFALNNLRDYKNNPGVLRSNPELLWEEIMGSVKRYYRITTSEIVDVPDQVRFALDRDVDLLKVVDSLDISMELKECASKYLDLLKQTSIDNKMKSAMDGFISECQGKLDSADSLHQIVLASGITISSGEVLMKLQTDQQLASELGLGTIRTMGIRDVNFWKVVGCDGVGFLAGGKVGAAAASAISIIMQW